jgi:hypothetical protein
VAKKDYKVEIDGNTRDARPIIEITTPDVPSSRVDVFDKVMETYTTLPGGPNKKIGGGHIRFKIHKKDITPAQMANLFRVYYSYQDFILFSFRHLKRSHKTGAPSLEEKNHFDALLPILNRMRDIHVSYDDLRKAGREDPNMHELGGMLRVRGLISGDRKFYDKYVALNIPRLYQSYWFKDKNYLKFEFRLFDAPRSKDELRLHLKFVKALVNLGMNKTMPYERKYLGHSRRWRSGRYIYTQALKEVCETFGLDYSEYEYLVEATRSMHF